MAAQITALPTPPTRADPTNFAARGDAFLAALPVFQGEANALSAEVWATYSNVLSATGDPLAKGTSTTSLAIGTGSKVFTTQASKGFIAGQPVIISSAANRANWMWGAVASYASTTLTVTVSLTGGSGTLADWDIVIANPPGTAKVTDFTSSGTWTRSAGCTAVLALVLGAGGGGGGKSAASTIGGSGGGAGGAYVEAIFLASAVGATETITVGAAGTAGSTSGSAGSAGGNSSFGAWLTAYGGGGGAGCSTAAGAGGGGGAGLAAAGSAGAGSPGSGQGGAGGSSGAGLKTYGTGQTGPTGGASNAAGVVGVDSENKPYAGGSGAAAPGSVTGTSAAVGLRGGCGMWGGAGGGSGGSTGGSATTTAAGGAGGISMQAGNGGGGGGGPSTTVSGAAGAGGSGGLNPLVGAGGAAGSGADGSAGGVGSGGGGTCDFSATGRAGGAGGRGHVRVVEFF